MRGYNDMAGKGVAEQGASGSKMEQFQAIMNKVVCKALKESASETPGFLNPLHFLAD